MQKSNSQRVVIFVVAFSFLAMCINSFGPRKIVPDVVEYHEPSRQTPQQPTPEQRQAEIDAEIARKKAEVAAAEHAAFLARHLNQNVKHSRNAIAIVATSENGRLNYSVANAVGQHLKTGNQEIVTSLFTPEFVSDGLFVDLFNGSMEPIGKLDLTGSLDAIVLIQQTVQYSKDASMENLVSATMQLQITLVSISVRGQIKSWTFSASGPGFAEQAARQAAEERILKQIAKDTKMTL